MALNRPVVQRVEEEVKELELGVFGSLGDFLPTGLFHKLR